tara:strand:- start:202 stop:1002 length:801 start_codon:yes stop_codon:yes gene_type:complete
MKISLSVILILFFFNYSFSGDVNNDELISLAVENKYRKTNNKSRDKYRHPIETLSFFGLSREKKILEITPGRGWYTEILANYMRNTNNYYVAKYDPPQFAVDIITKIQNEFEKYFLKNENKFGKIKYISINQDYKIVSKKNEFDIVLTFRNSHNWLDRGKAEKIYSSIYRSMKKGGILGVVQHRADESSPFNYKGGYVKESFLINFIENQGFKLINKSEINSNLKDTKNYEKGVWTLPPTYRLGEKDKSKYSKIGESDRMTLKFIK